MICLVETNSLTLNFDLRSKKTLFALRIYFKINRFVNITLYALHSTHLKTKQRNVKISNLNSQSKDICNIFLYFPQMYRKVGSKSIIDLGLTKIEPSVRPIANKTMGNIWWQGRLVSPTACGSI